ncbi:MAG: nucleotide exchange factor GrpE [Acidobacteria bacterium]|nr:nucleotide exchange factor GrpE [Acidobacteriota bacterium]
MELKSGDFVRHPRAGTVRVADVGPDSVSLRQKNGTEMRISKAEANRQLRLIPSDGYYALIYQREPDADWLRENIEDVLSRLMRDRYSRSIDVEDIKRELSPALQKLQVNWTSWWKTSRKKLTSSMKFTVDPHKKTRFLLKGGQGPETSSGDIDTRLEGLKDARAILEVARNLDLYAESDKARGARVLSEKALTRLECADVQPLELPELFCAVCYAASFLEGPEASKLISRLPEIRFERMPVGSVTDGDMAFTLSLLSKTCPSRAHEAAKGLLGHTSSEVASKAYSVLNTETNREVLKKSILDWIANPDEARAPRIEIYIRRDLIKYLRKSDVRELYLILIERPRLWEAANVRQFLGSPETAKSVYSDARTDLRTKISILRSPALTPEVKLDLVESEASPEMLFHAMVSGLDPETESALAICLAGLLSNRESSSWEMLIHTLRADRHPLLFGAALDFVRRNLKESSSDSTLTTTQRLVQLYELALERYEESKDTLEGLLGDAGSRLLRLSSKGWGSQLFHIFELEIEKGKSTLTSENEKLKRETEALGTKLQETRAEAHRLRDLAEMLKSSAAVNKQELEVGIRMDAFRPVVSLLDDLERQISSSADPSTSRLASMLTSMLDRAGVRRVGITGETLNFDPELHELAEEARELSGTRKVQVMRSGFILETSRGPRIMRRALVKLQ